MSATASGRQVVTQGIENESSCQRSCPRRVRNNFTAANSINRGSGYLRADIRRQWNLFIDRRLRGELWQSSEHTWKIYPAKQRAMLSPKRLSGKFTLSGHLWRKYSDEDLLHNGTALVVIILVQSAN